jgi:phytol kinase
VRELRRNLYVLELRRKLSHLAFGVLFAFLLISPWRVVAIIISGSLIIIMLAAAYLHQRFHVAFLGRVFAQYDAPRRPATKAAVTFFAGCLFAMLLFPPLNAALAILVLAVGDSVAAIIGQYAGKHKLFNGKTLEGTSSFIIAALVILVPFIPPTKALVIALIAAAAELTTPAYLDDNLSIPIITGLLLGL